RLARDIRSGIAEGKFGTVAWQQKIIYEHLHFNDDIFELTRTLSAQKTVEPKFVYAHLMIPHHPYYFDSKGDSLPLKKLLRFKNTDSNDYIEYLKYGNKKIMQLVDDILASSPTPPVIMLLSDHGFRHPAKTTDRKYDFMNLNAIYLPRKNYSQFNDSITNVNHFRVFFNSCFNQHLTLLKDSTVDLWD
ncbi:MAG: synthase family protein, partial [Chitinophagaceae bacterium]|nr:synthase family protein [Chitinophagaceae bacterium]